MGEFIRKLNKALLLGLTEEFDTEVMERNTVKEIRNAITEASDYSADLAKISVERILAEAEERKSEQERIKRIAEQEKEQERVDRIVDRGCVDRIAERESLDRIAEREFELEKLRSGIQAQANNVGSNLSNVEQPREKRINFKDLVPRFDPKIIDISLFFMLFKKQAKK